MNKTSSSKSSNAGRSYKDTKQNHNLRTHIHINFLKLLLLLLLGAKLLISH